MPGFDLPDSLKYSDDIFQKSKSVKSKGGFQVMGLSFTILKGITKRGYKIPTPVQRKTIPLILEGRNVVAMAKTGKSLVKQCAIEHCDMVLICLHSLNFRLR